MRIASLDLGSNTTLMLVADVDQTGLQVVEDYSTVTRMGQEIAQTGRLHPDALKRLDECLERYAKEIERHQVERVVAVATSAARDAKNSEELKVITDKHSIPVTVVPGQKEAEITFLGSTFDQADPKNCLVIDIGGGSTELVGLDAHGVVEGKSLDVGSVRLLDMFIDAHPVPKDQLDAAADFEKEKFSQNESLISLAKGKSAVAVAGTPTTLAMLMQESEFEESKIHKFQVKRSQVDDWFQRLAALSIEERKRLAGMPEKRADVMVAGSLILHMVLETLGFDQLTVSTKGVRYGLAIQEYRDNQ
ncbi:MAG: Ppx/GppA phosphatase family protein [Pseudomonadota bacterium]